MGTDGAVRRPDRLPGLSQLLYDWAGAIFSLFHGFPDVAYFGQSNFLFWKH
ncbi:MAG TPA: hypothetical protein VHZ97_06555 [Pseudonocardiaceae bacterium]|nr:hypothetical protein [Pseudonocardiaceae bacterium]